MPREIIIDISPAGNTKIDAQGFQGTSCADATEQIEIALGGAGVRKKRTPKPEYYVPENQGQHHKMTF